MDHLILVTVASCLAACGLVTDSVTLVIAAFFISPLMCMVLACTWSIAIGEHTMLRRALRNLIYDSLLAIAVGVLTSFVTYAWSVEELLEPKQPHQSFQVTLNSGQILQRGPPVGNVVVSFLVACVSGVAITIGNTSNAAAALTGVAVSTSLLPPLVNTGLLLGNLPRMGAHMLANEQPVAITALYSLTLWFVNICGIIVCSGSVFVLKGVRRRAEELIGDDLEEGPGSPSNRLSLFASPTLGRSNTMSEQTSRFLLDDPRPNFDVRVVHGSGVANGESVILG